MLDARQAPRSLLLPGLILALAGSVAVCGAQWVRTPNGLRGMPLFDYSAFWAAGRLTLTGKDPYDPGLLALLEQEAEPGQHDVLVMWPAPWALTALLPFSHADARVSHLRWLSFELVLLLAGIYGGWRIYGGAAADVWQAGLVAFTFLPTYFVLVTGQMGPLILLGFVAFLHFLRRGQEGLAGAALVLAAIKPQLALLFWMTLLLWSVDNRRWALLLGGIAGTAAALALPLWEDPQLLRHYWVAITRHTQTHGHWSPLAATALRFLFGVDRTWLQFVPLIPGTAWVVWYWLRHRRNWDWPERLPALIFASFLVAPYGAWPFDLVILLLPFLQRTCQLPKLGRQPALAATALFAVINVLALVQILADSEYFWFLWMAPALWLAYAVPLRHQSAARIRSTRAATSRFMISAGSLTRWPWPGRTHSNE